MSDPSERSSESMPGPDTSSLKPLSNAEDSPLRHPSNAELSHIMDRAGIALANGFPLDDGEDEEEMDEDYVAMDQEDAADFPYWFRRQPTHHRTKLDELHPFVQLLSLSNVEDCVAVENAFPEAERCSREKVREIFLTVLSRCQSWKGEGDYYYCDRCRPWYRRRLVEMLCINPLQCVHLLTNSI